VAASGDSWLTESVQRTRSELIGFRAEPVTLIVSWMWRASWIVPLTILAVSTTAAASESSPRKSSGIARRGPRVAIDLKIRCSGKAPVQGR
jgi:hypothetical protein